MSSSTPPATWLRSKSRFRGASVTRAGLVALLLIVSTSLISGCGYRQGEAFPDDVTSVSLPIFKNMSFQRGVEFELAEALTKEVQRRTPYTIARSSMAGTIIEGTIRDVKRNQLSRTEIGNVPQEVEVTILVDFVWRDQSNGEILRERRGFEAVGRHIPSRPIGEPFAVARRAAVERLARNIVTTMRGEWERP